VLVERGSSPEGAAGDDGAQEEGRAVRRRTLEPDGGLAHGPVEEVSPSRSRREGERADHVQEIKGLALFGLSLWLCVSMASYYRPIDDPAAQGLNWGGQVGFYLADLAYMATGVAGILLAGMGMAWGLVLVARKRVGWPALRVLSALCCVLALAFLIELAFGDPRTSLPARPARACPTVPVGGCAAGDPRAGREVRRVGCGS